LNVFKRFLNFIFSNFLLHLCLRLLYFVWDGGYWWLMPFVKLSAVGGRAFPVAGHTIWNSLPDNVVSVDLPSASENISVPGLVLWHYYRSPLNYFPTFSASWSDFITRTTLKSCDWLIAVIAVAACPQNCQSCSVTDNTATAATCTQCTDYYMLIAAIVDSSSVAGNCFRAYHCVYNTIQYNTVIYNAHMVPVKGRWCPAAGKVTVGLASHWPRVTDFSGLSAYGLVASRREMSTPLTLLMGHGTFYVTLSAGGTNLKRDQSPRGDCEAGLRESTGKYVWRFLWKEANDQLLQILRMSLFHIEGAASLQELPEMRQL